MPPSPGSWPSGRNRPATAGASGGPRPHRPRPARPRDPASVRRRAERPEHRPDDGRRRRTVSAARTASSRTSTTPSARSARRSSSSSPTTRPQVALHGAQRRRRARPRCWASSRTHGSAARSTRSYLLRRWTASRRSSARPSPTWPNMPMPRVRCRAERRSPAAGRRGRRQRRRARQGTAAAVGWTTSRRRAERWGGTLTLKPTNRKEPGCDGRSRCRELTRSGSSSWMTTRSSAAA